MYIKSKMSCVWFHAFFWRRGGGWKRVSESTEARPCLHQHKIPAQLLASIWQSLGPSGWISTLEISSFPKSGGSTVWCSVACHENVFQIEDASSQMILVPEVNVGTKCRNYIILYGIHTLKNHRDAVSTHTHTNYANKWLPGLRSPYVHLFHAEESNDLSSGDRINFNLHGVFWLTPGFVEGKTVRRKFHPWHCEAISARRVEEPHTNQGIK